MTRTLFCLFAMLVAVPSGTAYAQELETLPKIRVLLLGDSTVMGGVCHRMKPKADQLEDVVRKLLAADVDLPPVEVVNCGEDGDTLARLLSARSRYEERVARQAPFDFIFLRYGLNDIYYSKDFKKEYPADYHKLISRLRSDHPKAEIVIETVIPYYGEARDKAINEQVRAVAKAEQLPLLDQYAPYAAELINGPSMLSYRRLPLQDIPTKYRALIPTDAITRDSPTGGEVVYMFDNLLDVHLANVPGWFKDRHPNLAGYQVIGAQLAGYLGPKIRKRANAVN